MAKKGKEEEKGVKGKDAKKTKKEAASDSEEITDAEVTNTEESEMGSEMVEEEEEESEDDPKKKKGRDRKAVAKGGKKGDKGKKGGQEEGQEDTSGKTKKKQMKGASKLVMGLATEDAKKKKGAKKEPAKSQKKGATKATATPMPEAAAPKKQRSLKSASKLFMGFRGMVPKKSPKKGQFKNTSRFFWGLRKQSTKRKAKKKKNRGVLKSTSNLMMRFKEMGKKKKKEGPSGGGTVKKPSYMLIRLGGGKAAEKKDKGGSFLGGLFRKKSKPNENFKPRAQVVSKVASATAWLTRRFLSKRRRASYKPRVMDESWLSRIGAKKLPFPSGDEVMRHRANMRQTPERSALYEEPREEFGYWDNVDSTPLESYHGFQEDDYYGPQPSAQYGYEGYAGNRSDEGYGPEEERADDYDQDQFDGGHYDDQRFEPVAGYSPYDPYGDFGNEYEEPPGADGPGYEGAEEVAYPDDESYAQHEVSYSEHEWLPETQSSYNPYAHPLADIAETDETEEEPGGSPWASLPWFFLGQPGVGEGLPSKVPQSRKFRLFPRPQVKLFGKDKLDVTLLPPPRMPFEEEEEEGEEEEGEEDTEPLISPFAQFDGQPLDSPRTPGAFSTLLPGCFVSKLQRPHSLNPTKLQRPHSPNPTKLQRPHSPNPTKRQRPHSPNPTRLNVGMNPGPENPYFSPREFGSPLGQFLQRSLSQPKPILKHRGNSGLHGPPTPAPTRRATYEEAGSPWPSSPPLASRPFETRVSASSPKSVRHFGTPGRHNIALPSSHPTARLRDALQEELHQTLPFIGSSAYKKSPQGLGVPVKKFAQTATNESGLPRHVPSPRLSQRQNPSSSVRSRGSSASSLKKLVPLHTKENPGPSWGRSPTAIGQLSKDFPSRAPSSPRPTGRHSLASQRNPSTSSLTSLSSLKNDVPFSRSLFHVPQEPDPFEFQDVDFTRSSSRSVPPGFHNPSTGTLRGPPSPQASHRHFGSPAVPNPFQSPRRMSPSFVDPQGGFSQGWGRQNEPPTKAVKPLMRDQYMGQFGHQSPVLSRSSSPALTRQGSRRVTIRETPLGNSPYAQPFSDIYPSAETPWAQDPGWDYRGVGGLPPQPPSPTPSARKAFLQRIGHPLAGMAQAASWRPPHAHMSGAVDNGNPYLAPFGQSPRASPSFPRHVFPQDLAALSMTHMRDGTYPRSPTPKLGRRVSGGSLPYPVSEGNPGYFGRQDVYPLSPRMSSFRRPHAVGRGTPFMVSPPPFQDDYNQLGRPGAYHYPAELLGHKMEDDLGRYAVVTPQIQRMGSSTRRASHMQNPPWSYYHNVDAQGMPNEWSMEKRFQPPLGGSVRRRGSRRGGSSLFWYLTRGSSVHDKEDDWTNRNWQCKVILGVAIDLRVGGGTEKVPRI